MTTTFPYTSVEQIFQGQQPMAANSTPATVLEHMLQDAAYTQLYQLDTNNVTEDPNDPFVQFNKIKRSFRAVLENVLGSMITPELLSALLANDERLVYTITRSEWGRNIALMAYKCNEGGSLKSQNWINEIVKTITNTPVSTSDEVQSTLSLAVQSL